MIRIGERYINLRNVTFISFFKVGAKEQATIYYQAAVGYDSSLTRLEGQEAEALKWYLDQKASDVVGGFREGEEAKARRERYIATRQEIAASYPNALQSIVQDYANRAAYSSNPPNSFEEYVYANYSSQAQREWLLSPVKTVPNQDQEIDEVPF